MKGPFLIVEDEPIVREALVDILEAVGVTALAAANARDGIQIYRSHYQEIELVVLDMRLPEMDGTHVLRSLRHINPGVRAILASGCDVEEIGREFSNDPFVHVLQKPFDMKGFLRVVESALRY